MTNSKITRNLLVILIGILPVNLGMIYYRTVQTAQFTLLDLIIYPLTIGVLVIVIIFLLNKYLLKSNLKDTFNPDSFILKKEIIAVIGLTIFAFALLYISNHNINIWFSNNHTSSTEVLDAVIELSTNPILMVIWFHTKIQL